MTVHWAAGARLWAVCFACDGKWRHLGFHDPEPGVYSAQGDSYYSYDRAKVTCQPCLESMKVKP